MNFITDLVQLGGRTIELAAVLDGNTSEAVALKFTDGSVAVLNACITSYEADTRVFLDSWDFNEADKRKLGIE